MKIFQDKKVLITGATGLIGSHLSKKLLKYGAKVIVVGRCIDKLEKVFSDLLDNDCLSVVEGDVSEKFPVEYTDIDYIFHAASPISGLEIKNKPVDTIIANIEGIKNCLEHLKKQEFGRLIVFSSATVYGKSIFFDDLTVTEEMTDKADALHSINSPYSESKRMVEVLSRAYLSQYNVDSVIVRIAYVYGYSNPMPNTAFYEFIGRALNGKNIVLNNSGMGRRDNIHVDDVVTGLLLVANKGVSGEAYNLASNGELGNFCAIDEIASMIAKESSELLAKDVYTTVKSTVNCERAPGLKLSNLKAKSLGWDVKMSLTEGIKQTLLAYYEDMTKKEIN